VKNLSDKLTTLLVAYNLCNDAMDHGRVLRDYVAESMFHAGIITYYSIFKNQSDKKWLEDFLSGKSPPFETVFLVRHEDAKPEEDVRRYYLDVFKKFESIRDKNIAHKDPERLPENKREILQIPDGVAGSDVTDGLATYIVTHSMFLSIDDKDKREFLSLVGISIDILWQKEGLNIFRRGTDGRTYSVTPPRRASSDDENL